MSNLNPTPSEPLWTRPEKILFRFTFIYFLIQAIPLDWPFYRKLFSIDWGAYYYRDLFNLARYAPHFFGPVDTFVNWAVVALIALVGTVIWTMLDRKQTAYDELYYWLRVIVGGAKAERVKRGQPKSHQRRNQAERRNQPNPTSPGFPLLRWPALVRKTRKLSPLPARPGALKE